MSFYSGVIQEDLGMTSHSIWRHELAEFAVGDVIDDMTSLVEAVRYDVTVNKIW